MGHPLCKTTWWFLKRNRIAMRSSSRTATGHPEEWKAGLKQKSGDLCS